jgi:acetyl-CoA synthetase
MTLINLPDTFKKKNTDYQAMYQRSIDSPNEFWKEQANQFIDFYTPFNKVQTGDFMNAKWFEDATLNVCYQCVDRHLEKNAQDIAIIWEGDEPHLTKTLTYETLYDKVCRMSNVLKNAGVKKGDTVCIYLPMIPEAAIAMLACARIGAVHCVVFAGFSPLALQSRINDASCKVLITTNHSIRGGKTTTLAKNASTALKNTPTIEQVLLIEASETNNPIPNALLWQEEKENVQAECPCEVMQSEDPLFILYTSGSTGKPKGIVHTQAGYILYAAMTHQYVFNYQKGDIYWCAADVGWITGHTYIVYGPLANGATSLIFSGTPTYPTPARFWQIIDKHQVNIFYTAPTAIRALMREGTKWLQSTKRHSLKLLGSVGEPINPDVWLWYFNVVGKSNCPVVDTWWQTETGGVMISPLPRAAELKPGAAQLPFFGINPILVDEKGTPQKEKGLLAISAPWPAMARTVYGDRARYEQCFQHGRYMTGDEATVDIAGFYQIIGRVDDVLNVSGHRLGTAEIENALCEHFDVAEAAVVSVPNEIKGEAIYAFVTLKRDSVPTDNVKQELINAVNRIIGPIAKPDVIQWARELPKTRSGKIMRRILKKIALGECDDFGDTSTLSSPDVVAQLVSDRQANPS